MVFWPFYIIVKKNSLYAKSKLSFFLLIIILIFIKDRKELKRKTFLYNLQSNLDSETLQDIVYILYTKEKVQLFF
jgi:hypothetical protein